MTAARLRELLGNFCSEGYNFDGDSNHHEVITSRINLVFNEITVDEKRETFIVPLRAIGDLLLSRRSTIK